MRPLLAGSGPTWTAVSDPKLTSLTLLGAPSVSLSTVLATPNFERAHRVIRSAVGFDLRGSRFDQVRYEFRNGASLLLGAVHETLVVRTIRNEVPEVCKPIG
jgi:hypothetical protein